MSNFNFDEWLDLFERNPQEFECKRKEVLDVLISKSRVSNRPELRLLQMQCDALRQCMHPLEAAAKMTEMASSRLRELRAPMTELREVLEDISEQ